MAKELYVGSLPYDITEYELEKLFSVSGRVTSIHLITDAKTGQFKGCGYVRMSSEAELKDAIQSLDGARVHDRTITVSIATPQKQQSKPGGYKGKAGGTAKPGGSKHTGGNARPSSGSKPASKVSAAKPAASKPASKKMR